MVDTILVGNNKGRLYVMVEREGRKLPLLNRRGEIEVWDKQDVDRGWNPGFYHVLAALEGKTKMKVIHP